MEEWGKMRVRRRARVVLPQEDGPETPRRIGLEDILCGCVAFTLDEEKFSRAAVVLSLVLVLKRRTE